MILVDQEKVIEVSADFLSGRHSRKNVKFRSIGEGRINVRQHVSLDSPCQGKFRSDALLFSSDLGDLCNVGSCPCRQGFKRLCENLHLVIRTVDVFHQESLVVTAQRVDTLCHVLQRFDNSASQNQGTGDGQRYDCQRQDEDCIGRSLRSPRIRCERLIVDLFVLLQHGHGRLVGNRLLHYGDHRPVHGRQRYAGHIVFFPIRLNQLQAGAFTQGLRHETGKRRVFIFAENRSIRRQFHLEHSVLRRGKQHFTAVADHTEEAAIRRLSLHIIMHGGQKDIRPYHGDQLTATINGCSAHQTRNVRKGIQLYAGEDQLPCFRGLTIPGAFPRIKRYDFAVFCHITARTVVHIEDAAVRSRNEAGAELIRVLEHGQHDFTHVRRKAERLGISRIHPFRVLDLHGRNAVFLRIRFAERMGREPVCVFKQLVGEGLQGHDIGADIVKQIVGNIGLQRSAFGHG